MRNGPKIPLTNDSMQKPSFVVAPPIGADEKQDGSSSIPVPGWTRWAQLPSWLVSFVLHLSFFLFLASIVIPYSRIHRLSVLQFAFSKRQPDDIEMTMKVEVAEEPPPKIEKTKKDPDPEPTALPDTKSPQKQNRLPLERVAEFTQAIEKTIEPIQNIVASAKTVFDVDSNRELHDEIVDRFIAYDMGQLSGEAGRQARKEFQELGPDAIPSLVRGLNKSARYHASCPVGVISRKLRNTLKETGDQQLIAYAINHVGDGVTQGMPHSRSVFSMQKWVSERFVDSREQLVRQLRSIGIPSDDKMVGRVYSALDWSRNQLLEAAADSAATGESDELLAWLAAIKLRRLSTFSAVDLGITLADVIGGEDPVATQLAGEMLQDLAPLTELDTGAESSAAWTLYWQLQKTTAKSRFLVKRIDQNPNEVPTVLKLLSVYPLEMNGRDRYQLGIAATTLLESASSEASKEVAAKSLRQLAGGSDLGEDPRIWATYWREYKKIQVDEPSAMAKYRMAVMLLKRGKKDAAVDYFNQVIEVFPNTAAAKKASQGLKKIASTKNAI